MFKQLLAALLAASLLSECQFASAQNEWLKTDWWSAIDGVQTNSCESALSRLAFGRPNYRSEGLSFALDEYTWKDIGVERLIFPTLARFSPSLLGQLRIAGMLQHTSLSSTEIRQRQAAIREIQNDPILLPSLYDLFKIFSTANNESELVPFVTTPSEGIDKFPEVIGAVFTHLTWAIPTLLSALDPSSIRQNLGLAPGLVFMSAVGGQRAVRQLSNLRFQHSQIKRTVELTKNVLSHLENSQSPLLREIHTTLSNFDRNGSSANQIVGRYLNLHESSRILDYSYISSITLRRMDRTLNLNRENLVRLLSALSELAALTALAQYAQSPGVVFPQILDESEPTQLSIQSGHHPYVLVDSGGASVPNDISLSSSSASNRFAILTGINTGGKSTYLRMIASLVLLAQTGAPVPAEAMTLTPMAILTNMNVNDSVQDRSSFFKAQVARVGQIFTQMDRQRHALILLDEIFTGTSPEEHEGAERAMIEYLSSAQNLTVLATHDRAVTDMAQQLPGVFNLHVGDQDEPRYMVLSGVSKTRNAIEVMGEVGLPRDFLDLVRKWTR